MNILDFTPPEILFHIGSYGVRTYGIILALAVMLGYLVTIYLAKKYEKATEIQVIKHIDPIMLLLVVFGIVSARALFVIYHWQFFLQNTSEIFMIWHGGWVWHGAFIGGTLALLAYCIKTKIPFWMMADILAPGIVLGQAVGRWGNFFNQEAYGLPTYLFWGIPIEYAQRITGYEGFASFHPTFLYESLWDLSLFILLFIGTRLIIFKLTQGRKHKKYIARFGVIFLSYAIVYSLGRFLIEFLRIDVVPVVAGLRAPQWISIGIIVIAAYLLYTKGYGRIKLAGIIYKA